MTRRQSIGWSLLIAAFFCIISWLFIEKADIQLPTQTVPLGLYKVTSVADGDTITVDMNGTSERIRMIGVDTPETHDPNTPPQCYGPEASNFTTQTLLHKAVRLEADPTNDNRDRYDRLLRYVYLENGQLFEELLITQGFGFAYTSFPFEKSKQFSNLQTEAQASKKGLWAVCQPVNKNERWQSNVL